jgi:hypothetical protein
MMLLATVDERWRFWLGGLAIGSVVATAYLRIGPAIEPALTRRR